MRFRNIPELPGRAAVKTLFKVVPRHEKDNG